MSDYVVVTGCDSGIGYRLVETLLSTHERLSVVACYHSPDCMAAVPSHDRIVKCILDVRDDKSVWQLARLVSTLDGNVEGLVNNAGALLTSGPAEWTAIATDIAQMDVNFFGAVRVTKALLPFVRKARGRVVMVSSVLGLVASPLGGSYAASKFALEGWTDALRREMLAFGVRVSLVEPGMFAGTKLYQAYTDSVVKGYDRLPERVKSDYGERYRDYCVQRLMRLHAFFASDRLHKPVNAIVHALTSSRPKHRYREGMDCYFLARILLWLPVSFADLALTVTDAVLLRDSSMWPCMPAGAVSQHWGLTDKFALWDYCNTWAFVLLLAVFIIVYVFM